MSALPLQPAKVEIYSKDNCSYCTSSKLFFDRNGIPYTEFKLNRDYTVEEFKEKFPSARTVPQIIINGKTIGGYDELLKKGEELKLAI